MQLFAGVDPGKDGGIVLLDRNGQVTEKYKIPLVRSGKTKNEYDIPGIVEIVRLNSARIFTLEKSQPMPMSGIVAQFHRGFSSGVWQGIFCALGIRYQLAHSRTWQKAMFADTNAMDPKQASVIVAKRLWPTVDWRKSEKARNPDDGLTDAALIGMYGMRVWNGALERIKEKGE